MERLDKVMKTELASITSRRRLCGLPVECSSRGQPMHGSGSTSKEQAPADVGVCFSGGGMRSAAFSAGVLSALSTSGWIKRVDYISCVSSGFCTAASFISHATGSRSGDAGTELDVQAHLAASADRALKQLRSNSSSPMSRGNAREIAIFSFQIAGVLATCLVTAPLAAVCISIIFSRTLESLAGDELRELLDKGLVESHWMQINGWLFFFGPLTAAVFCATFAHLQQRPSSRFLLGKGGVDGSVLSPVGQMARIISWILICVDAVIVVMFLDERLFRGTWADEAVQASLALMWVYTVFALVFGSQAVDRRHETLLQGLLSIQIVSLLWLAARICVLRVTGRLQGLITDEYVWIVGALWAVAHDFISRSVHPLLRQRLRLAFLRASSCASAQDLSLLLPPPKPQGGRWSGNARWHPTPAPPRCNSIGDIYYGHTSAAAAPASPPRRVGKPEGGSEDADGGDPPLGEIGGDAGLPYLLVNLEAGGYVRRRAMHLKGAPQWDDKGCAFVLSPRFCGSERTGYFRTPNSLSLSSSLAMCCASDPFSASSSEVADGIRERFIRQALSTGDWLPLAPSPTAFASRVGHQDTRVGHQDTLLVDGSEAAEPTALGDAKNPVPNFFLDPTGSVPVTRAPPRPTVGLSHCPPWLVHALVPSLAVSMFIALVEPAFLVVPVVIGLAALLFSFLPEGRALLLSPQVRGMHRLLGTVHSSDRPPPFIHLSDGAATDRLGLVELLRRRCSKVIVCDATQDQENEFTDLFQAMERSRRELGCAFLPPHGGTGDVSTVVREFQSDATARCLRLRVEYFAKPSILATSPVLGTWRRSWLGTRCSSEDMVKTGDIWVLKSRLTSQDDDVPPVEAASGGMSMLNGSMCACWTRSRILSGVEWLQSTARRASNIWHSSCVDADHAPLRWEPSPRFFSSQTFTHFSALGARSAWSALDAIDYEEGPERTESENLPQHSQHLDQMIAQANAMQHLQKSQPAEGSNVVSIG